MPNRKEPTIIIIQIPACLLAIGGFARPMTRPQIPGGLASRELSPVPTTPLPKPAMALSPLCGFPPYNNEQLMEN